MTKDEFHQKYLMAMREYTQNSELTLEEALKDTKSYQVFCDMAEIMNVSHD